MLCACVAHVVEKAVRDARVAESQAERVAQARVRAARLTDLPFLLAGAAEQGAIAARGDAMVNNSDFFAFKEFKTELLAARESGAFKVTTRRHIKVFWPARQLKLTEMNWLLCQ